LRPQDISAGEFKPFKMCPIQKIARPNGRDLCQVLKHQSARDVGSKAYRGATGCPHGHSSRVLALLLHSKGDNRSYDQAPAPSCRGPELLLSDDVDLPKP